MHCCCLGRLISAVLATSTLVAGCQAGPSHVSNTLSDSDVIGTWDLTTENRLAFKKAAISSTVPIHFPSVMVFHSNHTCLLTREVLDAGKVEFEKVPGRWSIVHNTFGDSNVQKTNALWIEWNHVGGSIQTTWFNFTNETGPVEMWNYLGDPDSGATIRFIKNIASPRSSNSA